MINFERLTRSSDSRLIEEVISCYQAVFADPPWSEWKRCGVCGKSWGKEKEGALRELRFMHCGQSLDEFWSREEIAGDIKECFEKNGSFWVGRNRIGAFSFCWGFEITRDELEARLKIPLLAGLRRYCGGDKEFQIAYQSELGVLTEFRGQGHAKNLFKARLEDFLKQGSTVGVVRTREFPQPSVTYSWFTKKLGYQKIASYPEGDGRVILGRSLHGLLELL